MVVTYPAVVCKTPFGLPVEPEVYKMNRGSSLSITCSIKHMFGD